MPDQPELQSETFRLEEATIDELHAAIKAGRTTCVAIVQHYIDRARAYNGVASALVTEDGAPDTASDRRRARESAASFSDANRQGVHTPSRPGQVQGTAARIRPHGADGFRSVRCSSSSE